MQNQISGWFSTVFSTCFVTLSLISPLSAVEQKENDFVKQPFLLSQILSTSYTSNEGQFEVQLPGQPETSTRSTDIAGQPTDWNLFVVKENTNFYAVAYTDLAPETINLGANVLIDGIKNNLSNEFNWSAINGYGKITTVDGYPTRELIGIQNNQLSVLRLTLADRRLYAVMSSSDELAKISQFFASFAVQPWQAYVSQEGRFSIDLPMEPSEEISSLEFGETKFDWKVLESHNLHSLDDDSYAVAYADVSADDLQQGADELLEQVGINLIQKAQPLEIIEAGKSISLDGHPGRSFVFTTKEGQIGAVHFYLVNQRLYGVGARSEEITNLSKFLGSFGIQ
ncbi:hypothetical protein Xen7305DRAFT_00045050 [Xenococcus sp. PCC 7305]|uniref:hypothetical protein n=1 Tax=Xenococcus sp. PCC 7305 TaxID=102125 RepID=UPI0002AC3130|nr:hypothetical protein [Xenococcus sp. PCC 7305]ELS04769.1 hypothetical protein Xen7305DRAFT_00045050 [Xenococcus sp. PCC 7305]